MTTFTAPQIVLIKNYIAATPALAAQTLDGNGLNAVADALNAAFAPAFWVYKTSLSRHNILTETSVDTTTFAWAGAAYITRAQGERDAFREMFNSSDTVNPSAVPIQAAFLDIFSGPGGVGNRAHIAAMSRRPASVLEKLLAIGTGTSVAPATLASNLDGPISPNEVDSVRRS